MRRGGKKVAMYFILVCTSQDLSRLQEIFKWYGYCCFKNKNVANKSAITACTVSCEANRVRL